MEKSDKYSTAPRVLVTGGTGFIGKRVVHRLVSVGARVRVLTRWSRPIREGWENVEIVYGDVRNRDDVTRGVTGVDWVFHLAGKAHDVTELADEGAHHAVTTEATRNVVDAARIHGISRLIFLSSLAVYGPVGDSDLDERAPCRPATAYGRAKLEAQRYVLHNSGDMHVACLQPALVYGPGCKGNLPRMLSMIDRGIFPPLPDVGNCRSLAYVEDVVEAISLAAAHPVAKGHCFIVTDGEQYSTRRIYEALCQGLGKRLPRWQVPPRFLRALARAGDVAGRWSCRRFPFDSEAYEKLFGWACFSSDKICRELGYRPSQTLEYAMPELVAFYRAAGSR